MKKTITAILAIMMLFALSACGEKAPDISGKYNCTEHSFDGQKYDERSAEDFGESYLDLQSGGKGIYYANHYEYEMTWKLSGENFTGEVDSFGNKVEMTGTYKDNVLTIWYIDMWFRFVKE